MSAILGPAEAAWEKRASNDGALLGLLAAGAESLIWGYPSEVLESPEADRYPIIWFYGTSERKDAVEWGGSRIISNPTVWPWGDAGGKDRLDEIDGRLLELFEEQRWEDADGVRWYAHSPSVRPEFGEQGRTPIRRVRGFILEKEG